MPVDRSQFEHFFRTGDEFASEEGGTSFRLRRLGDEGVLIQPKDAPTIALPYQHLWAVVDAWRHDDPHRIESLREVPALNGLLNLPNLRYLSALARAFHQCRAMEDLRDRATLDAERQAVEWIADHRHECGLIYVKRGPQGAPLNFLVAGAHASSGFWSMALGRQPVRWCVVYHRVRPGQGDVWIGRLERTERSRDRFVLDLAEVKGPLRVALTFRALTGVKEPEKGIRYADLTEVEAASGPGGSDGSAPSDESDPSNLPDSVQIGVIRQRRGQADFRGRLLVAWHRRCAVTGCLVADLLEAAHIRPHRIEPNYSTSNGLLLRSDIHTLFDLALLSVDEDLRIHLAPKLLPTEYGPWDGHRLQGVPSRLSDAPSMEALRERHAAFVRRWAEAVDSHAPRQPPAAEAETPTLSLGAHTATL
jgi:hypothetical protein